MQDMTWRGFSNVKRARFADIKTELRLLQMQLRNKWNQHQIQIGLKIIPESFLTNKHSRFVSIAFFPTSTNVGKMQSNDSIKSNSLLYMGRCLWLCVRLLLRPSFAQFCLIWCFISSRCLSPSSCSSSSSSRWLPSPIDSSSYKQQSHSTMTMRQPPKLRIRENQLVEIYSNVLHIFIVQWWHKQKRTWMWS